MEILGIVSQKKKKKENPYVYIFCSIKVLSGEYRSLIVRNILEIREHSNIKPKISLKY